MLTQKNNRLVYFSFFLIFFHIVLFAKEKIPTDLKTVSVEEFLGKKLDFEALFFKDSEGNQHRFEDLFKVNTPIILNFVYYTCPMLCNLVVTGLSNVILDTNLPLGGKYRVISISMNPDDSVENAANFKQRYTKILKDKGLRKENLAFWHFLIGFEGSEKILADSVGFYYKKNEKTGEYAHGAALVIISPDQKISRYLYGIQYDSFDFKLAILEAWDEVYTSVAEKFLLFCYSYDPQSRKYVLYATNVMRGGSILILLIFGFFWYKLFYHERKKY